jgi:hypothetical protein
LPLSPGTTPFENVPPTESTNGPPPSKIIPTIEQQQNGQPATVADEQTCLPSSTFWALLLTLAGLLFIQISIVGLILVDRILLKGKYLGKKMHKILANY